MSALGDPTHQARLMAVRITAFEPHDLQAVAAARELEKLEPEPGAQILDALILLARSGGDRERVALAALGRALLLEPEGSRPQHERLLAAAHAQGLSTVAALFIAPPPVLSVDENGPRRADPALGHLTLGHKKVLARKANPDLLARLAAEGDPAVVQNILINPRLTESLVVRICARRPIRAEVLRAVYDSRRWTTRETVRRAMVQNPYCPPELALKILPTLDGPTLGLIAHNATLHASVRELAALLLQKGPRDE